ncbi:hypothetical protein CRG98_041371 [Punica granatum]|uniref:Uncharacterized protein n=1 Tax=Punica granatum TaxID=22663 RepID=A0A2I0I2Q3_PUNGR|nr:hypothetical protein CRG98_041371 [Punica granatum]
MGVYPASCVMHGCIAPWITGCTDTFSVSFAICTGALPCGLGGARTLARRDARALARRICSMHGCIPNGLAKITGTCPANLQFAQALTL